MPLIYRLRDAHALLVKGNHLGLKLAEGKNMLDKTVKASQSVSWKKNQRDVIGALHRTLPQPVSIRNCQYDHRQILRPPLPHNLHLPAHIFNISEGTSFR